MREHEMTVNITLSYLDVADKMWDFPSHGHFNRENDDKNLGMPHFHLRPNLVYVCMKSIIEHVPSYISRSMKLCSLCPDGVETVQKP